MADIALPTTVASSRSAALRAPYPNGAGPAGLVSNGLLDTTFGVGGKRSADLVAATGGAPGYEYAYDVEVLDDGGLRPATGGAAGNQIALMAFDADGAVDTGFSGDGLVRTNVVSGYEVGYALTVDDDGTMVVTGSAGPAGNEQVPVVRYLADGSLDTTFSGDGKLTVNYTASYDDRPTGVAVLDDGRVLRAGEADGRVALSQFLADGSPTRDQRRRPPDRRSARALRVRLGPVAPDGRLDRPCRPHRGRRRADAARPPRRHRRARPDILRRRVHGGEASHPVGTPPGRWPSRLTATSSSPGRRPTPQGWRWPGSWPLDRSSLRNCVVLCCGPPTGQRNFGESVRSGAVSEGKLRRQWSGVAAKAVAAIDIHHHEPGSATYANPCRSI